MDVQYDPTRPLISLHVPKTGGTSFAQLLQSWFAKELLLWHYPEKDGPPAKHILREGMCIHGHFNGARGFGVWQYYPECTQFITFYRDPFERFLSQWFHLKALAAPAHPVHAQSFESWIHSRAEDQKRMDNRWSFIWHLPCAPDAATFSDIVDERFLFIGIMDRFAHSVVALAKLLGKTECKIDHVNSRPSDVSEFARWRSFYERNFADECELYALARDFNQRLLQTIA